MCRDISVLPSLFSQRYFAKLPKGKHTARFGVQGRKRGTTRSPPAFSSLPAQSWGTPALHPRITAEPQDTLPATPILGATGPHPAQGQGPHLELGMLSAIHPWDRKAPAHAGEFRGTQKAAGVYLYSQYDCPTSPHASDWMGF